LKIVVENELGEILMNKQNVRCLASFRYSSRYFVSLLIVYTIMHH